MSVEPNPFTTDERLALLTAESDPLVMYLIVRESLEMSAGKVGAQCGHVVQLVMLRWMALVANYNSLSDTDKKDAKTIGEWSNLAFPKIVKRADDKEWEKLKAEQHCFVVRDAGLSEVEAGSETCIALWPIRRSDTPKMIKRLRNL